MAIKCRLIKALNLCKLRNYVTWEYSKHVKPNTVVSDFINIMKTTFDLNFNLYQALKPHGYT